MALSWKPALCKSLGGVWVRFPLPAMRLSLRGTGALSGPCEVGGKAFSCRVKSFLLWDQQKITSCDFPFCHSHSSGTASGFRILESRHLPEHNWSA